MRFTYLWRDDAGSDIVEYTLLIGFIALSAAAILVGMGDSTNTIWSIVNSRLASANQN